MVNRRRCCANNCRVGYYFIAVGIGVFMAYAIPRYLLITLLGIGLIGVGICLILKK